MSMAGMDKAGVLAVMDRIAATMEANKTRLIELDQAVGDGDLGLTMSAGFAAAAREAAGCGETEPGRIFMKAGMAINKAAPSTMGTLMATGFMRGGKAVAGRASLSAAEMTDFFQAFLDGVMERGKAKPGDKTIVDALVPAVAALRAATDQPLPLALRAAQAGAEQGVRDGKALMNQKGKAAVFREKTIGLEDPGSVAASLLFRAFAEAVEEYPG